MKLTCFLILFLLTNIINLNSLETTSKKDDSDNYFYPELTVYPETLTVFL